MSRYRYRTTVLTGPWRDTRRAAMEDAVKAKQALLDERNPDSIEWVVPGKIEETRVASAKAGRV